MTGSNSMRRVVVVIGLMCIPLGASASPEDLGPPSFRACAPAPQLSQIVTTLAGGRQLAGLRELGSRTVVVDGSNGQYQVRSDLGTPARFTASVSTLACIAVANDAVRLANGGSIPGYDIAAVGAVLAYREAHVWPYGTAHVDDPRTTLAVLNRNGRALVSIFDYKTLYDPGAFNCSGEEYYRVDLTTLDVDPYDGCFEGAPPQRILPKLKDLPG